MNTDDAYAKGRRVNITGEAHGNSRLTLDLVLDIRKIHAAREHTPAFIADMFGINPGLVYGIVKGTRWKHAVITTALARGNK
jgi:hypothetical protein